MLLAALTSTIAHKRNAAAQHAREAQLREALASMRHALTAYHAKRQYNPSTLTDLVRDGELPAIPIDPFTGSGTTWRTTVEESVRIDDFQPGAAKAAPAIVEVHSGASGADSSGRAFGDY